MFNLVNNKSDLSWSVQINTEWNKKATLLSLNINYVEISYDKLETPTEY